MKALPVSSGDLIMYVDAGIKNIHHGLIGPFLLFDPIRFIKARDHRPIAAEKNKAGTCQWARPGGRMFS